ncbi:uncharacterized protein [Nicotiana tomentosiformis]|uniref:uncharacterized protein n=1 Tax=Nicotiana tomentosiformis TaxID=4098 RepID=UPI00388C3BF0
MEVYLDDMLVKSTQTGDHFQYLSDTFEILRKYNMKLNPEKCAFGVALGKFLGFLVSNRGIEVNPAQIKAIEEIPDILTSKKEVQRLTWRIAALGRFISKSSEKSFKFFSVLKKQNQFEWTDECQQALKDLKSYLSNPPLLAKPKDGERLLIYFVVLEVAIPREENAEADALENLASIADVTNEENAIVIHLFHSALDQVKSEYGIFPKDKKKSQLLRQKVAWYCLIRGNLYRKMFGGPLSRCLDPSQMEYVMREEIVCDNGPQFIGTKIIEFFQSWKIKRITSAPYHPVANRQAESTNKVIINNLKKILEESKGKWPEVLLGVLWAYRTTTKTSTGKTLFSLVYDAQAFILVEIGESSTRDTHDTKEANKEESRVNLNLLEERREPALIRMASQKQMIERYYNRKVNLRYFKIGDFILKKVFRSTKAANTGKLSPNWDGPYRVRGIAGKRAYKLETIDGKVLPSN